MSDAPGGHYTLDSLKKEAKRWHRAIRSGGAEARARFERALSDPPVTPALRDVQHALAREHGFAGWLELKQNFERTLAANRARAARVLSQYEAMAEALLDAYRTGTPLAMERHYRYTWHRRAWRAMRTYVQLDLGKRPANADDDVQITLDDARHLVAKEYGFADWAYLQAFTKSPKLGLRILVKPLRIVVPHGPEDWQPIASSRDWDEIIRLLASHPSAALSGEGQMTDELLADLSRVETLTGLGLSGCRELTDDGLRHLANLPALQHLDLTGTNITDAGIEVLRSLPRLRTLKLSWTQVTDAGLSVLRYCHALERVNLAGSAAGDGALRALAGKPNLHHLVIAITDMTMPLLHELPVFKTWQGGDAAMSLVGEKRVPNHLSLHGSFTDRGMRDIAGLDGLFSLDIDNHHSGITAAGMEPLIELPHLGALGVDAKDDWMPHLGKMPRLRYLTVQDTTAGDDGFEALSKSPTIEYIWGRRCHNLRRRGFRALAAMPALRGLAVSCLNVDDVGVSALPEFPELRELMPMDVPDAGYRHVGKCENLASLILMYCRDTTDAATEHITGLRNLSSYFNSYTTVTDRTPELLSTMDSLERITFDTCHDLTNAGIARLARLPKLRELHALGRQITSEVRKAFPATVEVLHTE
jgi:hypothetical protein